MGCEFDGDGPEPDVHYWCRASSHALRHVVVRLLEVMAIQERRDGGEFHLSAEAFRPLWDKAKEDAQDVLYGSSSGV